ncbi:MAG: 8-amino-7-oxononanoate synthase [Nitrospinae bacterium]|nr:8-amino-7-oxononanoate synthase [Nitrospinota bacterium]
MDETREKITTQGWKAQLEDELRELTEANLRRRLRTVEGMQGPTMRHGGRTLVNLSSNNYLGLAGYSAIIEASVEAVRTAGASGAASPLISGHMAAHEELARELAAFKRKDAALVFGSGFLANLGLITALAGEGDAVFSDALNHASIVDGCRLSKAQVHIYPHRNVNYLEDALKKAAKARRKLIVTDGVFSMDGDLAPLPGICDLARKYNAMLVVDDAHGTGVIGEGGRGSAAYFGAEDGVSVSMGTLGKALASYGAFACTDSEVVDYLVNKARPYIYSTSLPPAVAAASCAALRVAQGAEGERRRENLANLCARFRAGLRHIGVRVSEQPPGAEVPIFPIIVKDTEKTLALAEHLMEAGVYLLAIRPPTVPEGTSRLRATLMATHTEAQIDRTLDALESGLKKLGILPGPA